MLEASTDDDVDLDSVKNLQENLLEMVTSSFLNHVEADELSSSDRKSRSNARESSYNQENSRSKDEILNEYYRCKEKYAKSTDAMAKATAKALERRRRVLNAERNKLTASLAPSGQLLL